MIELSRYVLEALRKDEEFILYRGRSQDDTSRAAFASRLRQATACPDSLEMQSAEGGRDEALAESGYGAPLVLGEPNVEGEPLGNVSPSRVLVLSPVAEHPSPESVKRLEHAYSFKEELDPAWAVRPIDLARHRDRIALVLEDPGGKPLDQFGGFGETRPTGPPPHALDSGLCFRIGINLANAIGHLHRRGIVHKDIKPANVLVNSATGQVWLTGLGIASRLPRERQSPDFPEFLEGTLAYMAPEQTGRMNRSIDSRSDLYSLGITLYEMVTGSLPFTASDPMEWVHCHIARKPVPPSERLKTVPLAVSAIILKMLAKTAEERYLTAAGVESDLRRCLADWQARGRIDEFPLGEHDTPDRLLIPEKLYGRRREIDDLLASFERVMASGRPELVLVSGYSGIGKSSVVNELHKVLVEPRGLFASGKFDQYKRDIPYATPAQAFQGLIRSLLGKSDAELSQWRDALREALDPNGQLIVHLVPELELIIGEQPPVPELASQDAQRRFQLVLRRFISVFARPEHPLALFLDDLQWLDAATLDLLEDLLRQPEVRHLLLIGAYRDNEVNSSHPLMRKLEEIRQEGAIIHEMVLAPLSCEDLGRLIAESLHCEPVRAAPLAQLVHRRTGGNPFFASQFIIALAEEELLRFDYASGSWAWDVSRIVSKGYTDNVVDLMLGKLNRLPVETQKALKEFACLGNSAEITTLAIIHGTSEKEVHSDLWEALRLEFIVRSEGSYKFVHDRVQEAAYSLIPEELRAEAHLQIGRLLRARIPPGKREEAIFDIVNQLNRGAVLIDSRDEREQLAEFNLLAGKRAKASTAYNSALKFFIAGAALLANDRWERRHKLSFALEFHRAECEFLTGALADADARLVELSERAANTVEQATVACLRIDLCTAFGETNRAVATGLDFLRQHLSIDLSAHPNEQEVGREYARIWSQLGSRTIEDLMELPLMSDPACLATLDVLTTLEPTVWHTDANLACMAICIAVNLSLEQGNSDGSCYHYVKLSHIAGPRFGDYAVGYRFGRLGYQLVERCQLKRFQARVYQDFGGHVVPWTRHVRAGRDTLRRALEIANQNGDITFASYSYLSLNSNLLAAGDPLVEVQREVEISLAFARKVRFQFAIDIVSAQLGLVRSLRGLTRRFGSFNERGFDELEVERRFSDNPNLILSETCYWVRKLQARFFAGDYAAAVDSSSKAQRLPWTFVSQFEETPELHFYGALSRAACCDSATADQRVRHLEALAAHHRQLQIYAENCPENYENRAVLVAAEIARIEGRDLEAMGLYEQAVSSAHTNGFVNNEAVANEVAARFYAARGFKKIAYAYLRDARYCYLRWGADGKVRQLDELYPHLRAEETLSGPAGTIGAPVEHLDLATVLKVSLAVSGEIVPEKLIETILKMALEHAGAERGLLILPHGEQHRIEAQIKTDLDQVQVQLRHAPITSSELPESLFRYVIRTQQTIILDDASANNMFSEDDYLRQRCPRSILCLPLVKQTKVVGALYLEHNLAPRVFTQKRLVMLEMLASQAAISLDHARLYSELSRANANLEHEISERLRAETAARRSEAYLAEAESLSKCGSWALKPATKEITYWSPQRYHLFGFDPDAGVPSYEAVLQRVHPEDQARWLRNTEEAERRDSGLEFRVVLPDGGIKQLHGVGHPVFSESGELVEIIGAAMDITERKRAEEQQREAEAQLAHVARVTTLGEMAASIAHEINQPLAGIAANANASLRWLARDSPDLAEAREAISRIIRDTNRASDVISRMRALFRKAPAATETVDINEVIQEVLTLTQAELQRNRVSSRIQFANDLPMVIGDKIQLQQVILNLVVNAIEAMSGVAGGARELCVSSQKVAEIPAERHAVKANAVSEPESGFVLIEVRDSGTGLDSTQLKRVFEPFYTTKSQGMGVGLTISRSIIEAHHGLLWVTENAPQGAVFQFTLPCTPVLRKK